MSRRFYVDSPILGDVARLQGGEARHLIRVMRARPGDRVTLFDGGGAEFPAQVLDVQRSWVRLRILARQETDRELSFPLTLGVALPKGDRQRWLVEKSVELGVTRLAPLQTERGVAQPTPSALERLRRAVIESSKQSGRNRLMEILAPRGVVDYASSASCDAERWIAHPGGGEAGAMQVGERAPRGGSGRPVFLAIGPEGGFTPEEVGLFLAARWRRVDLGPRILRVETAAVALASLAALGRVPATAQGS